MNYNFKYVDGRIPVVGGVASNEIDDCFRVLRELFGDEWLTQKGSNIIQQLWAAPYILATTELYALGFALRRLNGIKAKFVAEKVILLKSNDPKDVNGALFEVFALGAFAEYYSVTPAKENQPGFDGEVDLGKGKSINLSIKNYAISLHQRDFMSESAELEKLVNNYINAYKCPGLEVIIHKKTGYPSKADWKELSDNIHGAFITYNNLGKKFLRAEIGGWSLILQELMPQDGTFANLPKSYTLIISSPFHKNEEKNLFDKLDEAVANIVKHQPVETTDRKNCVIIHLPMIGNRKSCRQWALEYFKNFPEKAISAIILVQPLVVKDAAAGEEFISIGTSIIGRLSYGNDFASVLPLQFKMPIGKRDNLFYTPAIFIREDEKNAYKIEMENCYVYQQGHHFYNARVDAEGTIEVPVEKIASGIVRHTVFLGVEVAGRFEPIDKLEIL